MEDDIILKIDSSKVREYLNDHLIKVLSKGYSQANLDSLHCQRDSCLALIYRGERMSMGELRLSAEQKSILKPVG